MLKNRRRSILAILHVALAAPCLWSQERSSIEFSVVNHSSHVIHRIYVSPSRNPQWGENLLRGGPLSIRGETTLRLVGTCGVFDLRFVADEGIEYLDDEVDLCNGHDEVTIGERALTWTEAR